MSSFNKIREHQNDENQEQDLLDGDEAVYKAGEGKKDLEGEPDKMKYGDYEEDTPEEAENAANNKKRTMKNSFPRSWQVFQWIKMVRGHLHAACSPKRASVHSLITSTVTILAI